MADLRIGRVAAVHPEDMSVDLVMTDDGSQLAAVQVLSPRASSNTGLAGMAVPAAPGSGNKWDLTQRTSRDAIAVVGYFRQQPVVLGFLFPQICGMTFSDPNRMIERYPSDVYTSVDGAGNTELYHPSGTYLRIGTSAAHEDLTGRDVDGQWAITQNTGTAVNVQLTVKNAGSQVASLLIDPSGNVTLTHSGNLAVNTSGAAALNITGNAAVTVGGTTSLNSSGAVSITAPSVTITAATTTVTGTLTVGGLFTFTAGMAGSGGGATSAAITGAMTVTGQFTSNGIGYDTHYHVQSGGGNTGGPVA